MNLTAAELQALQAALPTMGAAEKLQLLEQLEQAEKSMEIEGARSDLINFAVKVYPNFSVGSHHKVMAKLFKEVLDGTKKRVIINMPPRHSKSETASYLLPAWFLGHKPDAKIIMATHTQSLSEDFGRRVRNLIADPEYQEIFPETSLQTDAKAAGVWGTKQGGRYYAVGVGGALAGRGADLLIIDDPHALPLDTEVPTPSGFRTIGALRVGDEVFGPDGLPTRVVAKSDIWANRELYSVTTSDGEVVHCDAGHLWAYRSDTNLRKGKTRTATARELACWSKVSLPCMPRHAAVQYQSKKLPIDPYVLGAWLGDGTSSLGRMTAHPDDSAFMREQFEAAGYEVTDQVDAYCFGVKKLRAQLIELGLLNNKHVPPAYMEGSVEQRMALLQGMMDTDGTVTLAGQCSFQNTNEGLVQSVRSLLHSLGVKARMCAYFDSRERHASRKIDYRVNFKLQDAARMPRKRIRTYTPTDKRCRSFVVEKTALRADVQCITVEREDGQFLVGRGYVVTHNSEQDIKTGTRLMFDQAYNWYQTGPRQRLQWGAAIVLVMTRWATYDLTARLLDYAAKNPDADQWEVIEFPAILPSGKSLWPEKWPIEQMLKTKASLDAKYWTAQYMQDPSSDEAAIIARSEWRVWEKDRPPRCSYIIQCLDTASETNNRADFTSITTWGVFTNESEREEHQIILLDRVNERMQFPELKAKAIDQFKRWEPDAFIVEKKGSGTPLYQELRQMGLPVTEYTPHRGSGDKVARLNAVADIVRSGKVWIPDMWWAKELVEQVAQFPNGQHDDDVDTCSMALMRFRQGGYLTLATDDAIGDNTPFYGRRAAYY